MDLARGLPVASSIRLKRWQLLRSICMERLSNPMKIHHFLLSVLSALFLMGTNLDARLFTTVDGKKVYGSLVEANENFVKIKRQSDGRVFTVGLNRLSRTTVSLSKPI